MTGGGVDDVRQRSTGTLGESLLVLDDVCGAEVVGLDLQVRGGEVVGVAGITGSGREELCGMIFGARPREGRVSVRGRELPALSPHTSCSLGVALVPANRLRDGVVIGLNVRENINLTTVRRLARLPRIRRQDDRGQAVAMSREMSVKAPSVEAPIEALSGGNQQKVVLGKWLQTNPSVLLLDEPTQGVDIKAKAEIHHLVDAAAGRGMAVPSARPTRPSSNDFATAWSSCGTGAR